MTILHGHSLISLFRFYNDGVIHPIYALSGHPFSAVREGIKGLSYLLADIWVEDQDSWVVCHEIPSALGSSNSPENPHPREKIGRMTLLLSSKFACMGEAGETVTNPRSRIK